MSIKTMTDNQGHMPQKLITVSSAILASLLVSASTLHAAPLGQTAQMPQSLLDSNELELKGFVESAPGSGGVGSWTIGGLVFVADANTEIDEANGPLTVGVCAEVDYEENSGQNVALSIESDDDPTCDPEDEGSEDEDAEDADGAEDEDSDEDGPEDEDSEDEDSEDGDSEDEDSEDEDADGEDEDENETYGTIASMPAGTFIGNWIIDGVTYVSNAATEIEEEYGPLTPGTSVEVEFEVVNGVNQLLEIESLPASGQGPTDRTGLIESTDAAANAVSAASTSAASIRAAGRWQVGGVTYTVAPTTQLDESAGSLVVGATAAVNSFTSVDGREIATEIRTVTAATQSLQLYLPLMIKS